MGSVGSQIITLENGAEVYLGTLKASENQYLQLKNVHFVVNCAEILPHMIRWNNRVLEMEATGTLKVLRLKWKDERAQKLNGLAHALRFVHAAVLQGEGALIHCEQGKSRSGSVMIAYLMAAHGMSLQTALTYVKDRRSIVRPNGGFMKQLTAFETSGTLALLRHQFAGGPKIVTMPSSSPDSSDDDATRVVSPPKPFVSMNPVMTASPLRPPLPTDPKAVEDGLKLLKEGLKQLQRQLYDQQLSEECYDAAVEILTTHYLDAL